MKTIMRERNHEKENRITAYLIMLFLIIWASFMFFGIRLMIDMIFLNLSTFSKFGFLGIILYLPFILIGLLFISPFYLLFKKIYNIVASGLKFFKADKMNLFFSFVLYYGMPLFFATIIANQVLKNYRPEYHNTFIKHVVVILPLVVIQILDYVYSKILQKNQSRNNRRGY